MRKSTDPKSLDAFAKRLVALGTAHDTLLSTSLQAADLRDLIDRALHTAGIAGRYTADGPPITLGARATLSTSLLLHELATNALKYGALSWDGIVELSWQLEERGETVVLEWRERGGPPAIAPTSKGFGSRLLTMGMLGTGGTDFRYEREGFSASFRASRQQLAQS